MTTEAKRRPAAALGRKDWLALACCGVWTASSLLSRQVGMWSAVGGAAVGLGLLVLLLDRKPRMEQFRTSRDGLALGLAAGALMIAGTYVLYPVVRHLVPQIVPQAIGLYATLGNASGPGAILLLCLVVLGEELVWRGVVYDAFAARWGPVGGALLSTFVYCLAVLPTGLPLLIAIAGGCGLYWSALKAWTRSLTPVLVTHLLWDLVVLILMPLARSGP